MIVNVMGSLSMMALASEGTQPSGNFMDSLPDPMKLQLPVVLFVIVVLIFLFLFLKFMFFKPLIAVMDNREEMIRKGSETKLLAASQIESRQSEYNAQLRELRAKAFEHRKALATAVTAEKQVILEDARNASLNQKNLALEDLKKEKKRAEIELRAQVEALSESMVQHLLRQA